MLFNRNSCAMKWSLLRFITELNLISWNSCDSDIAMNGTTAQTVPKSVNIDTCASICSYCSWLSGYHQQADIPPMPTEMLVPQMCPYSCRLWDNKWLRTHVELLIHNGIMGMRFLLNDTFIFYKRRFIIMN